jgi:hypothetical protein
MTTDDRLARQVAEDMKRLADSIPIASATPSRAPPFALGSPRSNPILLSSSRRRKRRRVGVDGRVNER